MTGPVEVNDDAVFVTMMRDPGLESVGGLPLVLAGRLADEDADDEAVINERFRDVYGVDVGDRVQLQFLTATDLGSQGGRSEAARPAAEVEIVGLIRTEDDLNSGVSYETREVIQTPPGVERRAAGAATIYSAIMIRADDEVAVRASIEEAFRGRTFNSGFNFAADDFVPIDDAYRYESRAAAAFAVVTALAGLVFVGQAMSRQVRKEWSDLRALRALGMSSAQVAGVVHGSGGTSGPRRGGDRDAHGCCPLTVPAGRHGTGGRARPRRRARRPCPRHRAPSARRSRDGGGLATGVAQ